MNASNMLERITIQPGQCHGRPCIRGMRVRVSDILAMLVSGMDVKDQPPQGGSIISTLRI